MKKPTRTDVIDISGTITIKVDEVDIEQLEISMPVHKNSSLVIKASIAALKLESAQHLIRQVEAMGKRLAFERLELTPKRYWHVHFNIVRAGTHAN